MVRTRIALTRACLVVGTASAAAVALAARQTADTPAGRPSGSPVTFLRGVVATIARNAYASAWQSLTPAQQLVAPLAEYVSCESKSPIPGRLEWVKVLRVQDERRVVPGTSEPTTTVAVTLRLEIAEPGGGESVRVTHTVHAVAVDGRWTWMLPADRYEMYLVNGCAFTPPA